MPASKKPNAISHKSRSFAILAIFILVFTGMLFYLISNRPAPVADVPTAVSGGQNSVAPTTETGTAPTTANSTPSSGGSGVSPTAGTTQNSPAASPTAPVTSTPVLSPGGLITTTTAPSVASTSNITPTGGARVLAPPTTLPAGGQNRPSPTLVVAPTPTLEKSRASLPPAEAVGNGFTLKLNQPEVALAVGENGQNIVYRFKLETIVPGSEEERAIRRFVPGFPSLYGLAIFYSSADTSVATNGQFYYLGETKTGNAARLSRNFIPGGNYTATDVSGSCRTEPGCQLYLGKTAEPGAALLSFNLSEKLNAGQGYLLRIVRA